MRAIIKIFVYVLSVVVLNLGFMGSAVAEEVLIADHFIVLGDTALKAGDRDEAYQYFSRALLAQPGNSVAQQRIESMGYEDSLYPLTRTASDNANRLEKLLAEYKSELETTAKNLAAAEESVKEVRQERDQWIAVQNGTKLEALVLEDKLLQVQDMAIQSAKQRGDRYSQMTDQMAGVFEARISELRKANEALAAKLKSEDSGAFEIEFYQQKYREALAHSLSAEKELRVLSERYQQLAANDHNLNRHQDKLIRVLEDYSRLAEEEAADAKDRLVSKQMDLVKREQRLIDALGELEEVYQKARP